jgi:hypothetical protein
MPPIRLWGKDMKTTLMEARSAKAKVATTLPKSVTVVGVGVARSASGGYIVKVNLSEPPPAGVRLPKEINGVPIRVEVVGAIVKR